jgi:hypothetical protein
MWFEWKANRNVIDTFIYIATLKKEQSLYAGNIVEFRNVKSVMRAPMVRKYHRKHPKLSLAEIINWQHASRVITIFHSFIKGSTALCWALASFSVS